LAAARRQWRQACATQQPTTPARTWARLWRWPRCYAAPATMRSGAPLLRRAHCAKLETSKAAKYQTKERETAKGACCVALELLSTCLDSHRITAWCVGSCLSPSRPQTTAWLHKAWHRAPLQHTHTQMHAGGTRTCRSTCAPERCADGPAGPSDCVLTCALGARLCSEA